MNRPDALPLPVLPSDIPETAFQSLFGATHPEAHALGDGPGTAEALPVLHELLGALRRAAQTQAPSVLSLAGLSADAQRAMLDALADGEVTAAVQGAHRYRLRETALPGVWHVTDETAGRAYLEVADVPQVVRAAHREGTREALSIGQPPGGAMNVLPLLAELRHRMQRVDPSQPNHVLSFTLLPMNEVDMRHLETQLGHGPVLAESRGYGHTRVELTLHRHLWSVQYLNVMGTVILDTLEVGDVPAALLAGQQDLEDSGQRLAELLGV